MNDGSTLPGGITGKWVAEQQALGNIKRIDKYARSTQEALNVKWIDRSIVLDKLDGAIDAYKNVLTQGTQILPSKQKMLLQNAYTELLLQAKDEANLGVLTGPDMDLLENMYADPTAVINTWIQDKEPGALEAQLDLISQKILRERGYIKKRYRQKDGKKTQVGKFTVTEVPKQ